MITGPQQGCGAALAKGCLQSALPEHDEPGPVGGCERVESGLLQQPIDHGRQARQSFDIRLEGAGKESAPDRLLN